MHTPQTETQHELWKYYQGDGKGSFAPARGRVKYLAHILAKKAAPQRILNIGIGDASLERALQAQGHEVFSCDPDQSSIEALHTSADIHAQVGVIESLPFADSHFDVVIASEVLEHLRDDQLHQGLQEVRRVLKSGGQFLGTVPADENLEQDRVFCPHCKSVFHRWGHEQIFSAQVLGELIGKYFVQVRVERHYMVDFVSLNLAGKIHALVKWGALKLGREGSGESFVFWGEKEGEGAAGKEQP